MNWSACTVSALFNWSDPIIRPPRKEYKLDELGPTKFEANGIRITRRDMWLKTDRGTLLVCSHFEPAPEELYGRPRKRPVIVYLHGNSSCRLEALDKVSCLISHGMTFFCYDAHGCGLSGGDYVSLGWHERDDLAMVIRFLRESPHCGPIGVWGRSMGAVTALMHAGRDNSLGALCMDSPFSSFIRLAGEMVLLPTWLLAAPLAGMRARIQALADFDIEDLEPATHAPQISVPGLFLHGTEDGFVTPGHSRTLFDAYGGNKQLAYFPGDHNSARGDAVHEYVANFFVNALHLDEIDLPSSDQLPASPMPSRARATAPQLAQQRETQQRQVALDKHSGIEEVPVVYDEPDLDEESPPNSPRCQPAGCGVRLRTPKWALSSGSASWILSKAARYKGA